MHTHTHTHTNTHTDTQTLIFPASGVDIERTRQHLMLSNGGAGATLPGSTGLASPFPSFFHFVWRLIIYTVEC